LDDGFADEREQEKQRELEGEKRRKKDNGLRQKFFSELPFQELALPFISTFVDFT